MVERSPCAQGRQDGEGTMKVWWARTGGLWAWRDVLAEVAPGVDRNGVAHAVAGGLSSACPILNIVSVTSAQVLSYLASPTLTRHTLLLGASVSFPPVRSHGEQSYTDSLGFTALPQSR